MNKKNQSHNIIEKTAFAWGILVLAAILSFLVYRLFQSQKKPPQLEVSTYYQPTMDHYAYKVKIKNNGDETAENAQIKLTLYQNGKPAETGIIGLEYVPVKSEETAWIVFGLQKKPDDSLVISGMTYGKP